MRSAQGAWLAVALVGCGSASADESFDELVSSRQEVVDSMTSLRAVERLGHGLGGPLRGLTTHDGAATMAGYEATGALRARNGLKTRNGLTVTPTGALVNASATLPVDCGPAGVAGQDCWGSPNGLLSAFDGLMQSDRGMRTAKYLVRCALPPSSTIGVLDYTGAVVRLKGELGLAPEWAASECGEACQRDVSACLMALTQVAEPVELELSASGLGGAHSKAYPYQEAVFYGNLFLPRPEAHFCAGKDATSAQVRARVCAGSGSACPYVAESAASCAADQAWTRAITTYRKDKP